VTPAEKRARARNLRSEARKLDREAKDQEFLDNLRKQQAERERLDAEAVKVGGSCRPVWKAPPRGHEADLLIVRDVTGGRIIVGHPSRDHTPDVRAFRVRGGGYAEIAHWTEAHIKTALAGHLNIAATLEAWRAVCAARKAAAEANRLAEVEALLDKMVDEGLDRVDLP
jgi:hypothetical protein